MTSDEAAIRANTAELAAAFNDGDVDRMMRVYGTRYVDVNLPQPEQTHSERARYYRNILAVGDLRIDVIADEIIVHGAHATVRGSIHLSRSGDSQVRCLRYMELWEKQASDWKAIWGIDAEIHA